MGSCSLCGSKEVKLDSLQTVQKLHYSNSLILKMKTGGMFGTPSSCKLTLTKPAKYLSYGVQLKDLKLWISGSVLPGIDPRGIYEKPCQDTCFARSDGDSILIGVYDGHGTEGHKVAELCQKFIISYYFTNKELYQTNPEDFLIAATRECDIKLQVSHINITFSGSTQVLILIYNSIVYTASVGDSRAVLAYHNESTNNLNTQDTEVTPLSEDQKPENPAEKIRIEASGGKVHKLIDECGCEVGPYRVWRGAEPYPGLAMARSLGDTIAANVGVISTPVVTLHKLDCERDLFIVAGSDGLWDVMENQEVTDFVSKYRHIANHDLSKSSSTSVNVDNSHIARLLSEEARLRWITVVENEGVIMDDISAIILEFTGIHHKLPITMSDSIQSTGDICNWGISQIIKKRDPVRSSIMMRRVSPT